MLNMWLAPGIIAHLPNLSTSGRQSNISVRIVLCCTLLFAGSIHSATLSGDLDRSRLILGCDFWVEGEAGFDGGDPGTSFSRAARALNALVLDSSFFSLSFPAGGVPVRLLALLSSPRLSSPPGPRPRRPLLVRPPSRLGGPNDPVPVLLGLRAFRVPSLRRSSVPTRLELSGGGIW